MPTATDTLKKNLIASIETKQRFLLQDDQLAVFDKAVQEVVDRYRRGGRLYIAGNGGSAAGTQHLAAEFVSKLACDRAPLAAEALTVDTAILTAIGNDYGYDQVFSRQVAGKMTKNDIFLGITTSWQSPNILNALIPAGRWPFQPSFLRDVTVGQQSRNRITASWCQAK